MVAFSIFGRNVYRYGIFYLIGFLFAYSVLFTLGKKKVFKDYIKIQDLFYKDIDIFFIILILGVLIGGRLGHVFIYDLNNFIGNRSEIFKIWHGGMSFIGGISGVVLGVFGYTFFKKFTRKETFLLFDILASIVPLCIALGRFGNFLNQELYGIPFSNSLGLSESIITGLKSIGFLHIYPHIDSILRINTNFLSITFEGILLFIVTSIIFYKQIKAKKRKVGLSSMTFILRYSIVRFLLEYLRADSQLEFIGPFTKSQRVFLCFILCGIVGSFIVYRQKKVNL